MILTNQKGVPFEKPERPALDASLEEKLAYMQAMYAYDDAIRKSANEAFDTAFRKYTKVK